MLTSAEIVIKGIVQGVGFRWFVKQEADNLALQGYVKNLPGGDVFVEVEGDRGLIQELIKQLQIGNRASHVTGIDVKWTEFKNKYSSFQINFF